MTFNYEGAATNHKIILDTPIELIDYTDSNQVRLVSATGEEFFADTVVVATPLNILQDNVIAFDPPVPQAKRDAWDGVYVTDGLKVWLEFSHRFYPDWLIPSPIFQWLANEDRLYFDALFGKDDLTDRHVLALFEVGPTAEDKVILSDDDLIQLLLQELDCCYCCCWRPLAN